MSIDDDLRKLAANHARPISLSEEMSRVQYILNSIPFLFENQVQLVIGSSSTRWEGTVETIEHYNLVGRNFIKKFGSSDFRIAGSPPQLVIVDYYGYPEIIGVELVAKHLARIAAVEIGNALRS